MQTSRGCKYSCAFCSWISLYGKSGYCVRPVDDVVHDIVHAIEYTGIRNFIVSDNLFAGDVGYTEELMGRILRTFEGKSEKPRMTVLCRADQFTGGTGSLPEKTIKTLARGGVANVSLGLESISSRSLLQMRKRTELEQYFLAADTLRRNGIGILATFVAGFDGDSYEDVVNIAEFGDRIGLFTIQVYSRSIMPGTLDEIMSEHRILPRRPNKYFNGHGVGLFPAQMLPSTLQQAIFEAAFRFHRRGEGKRKPALRAFQSIWGALLPHYESLLRLEKEVLIPKGIYKPHGAGFVLNEKLLHTLMEDEERYEAFARKAEAIFSGAELLAAARSHRVNATPAIA